MDNFGAAMTGVKPKSLFLSPNMALPLGAALLRLSLSISISLSRSTMGYDAGPRAEPQHGFGFAENAVRTP